MDQPFITGRIPSCHMLNPMILRQCSSGARPLIIGNTDKEGAIALEVYGVGSNQKRSGLTISFFMLMLMSMPFLLTSRSKK